MNILSKDRGEITDMVYWLKFEGFEEEALALINCFDSAHEMLRALQRLTHPASDDEDLAYALEVIAKATGGQS